MMKFINRKDAGERLAKELIGRDFKNPVVIALPRGGVPVGAEIARKLGAPLDVLIVRKIGAPGNPEYGIGAIAEGNSYFLTPEVIDALGIGESELDFKIKQEMKELKRRIKKFRGDRRLTSFKDRTVILVDDGLATGVTATVAAQFLSQQGAQDVVFVAPVCARESAERLRQQTSAVFCLQEPEVFRAVGLWYEDFEQTTDEEVIFLLNEFHQPGSEQVA
jgi:putative phosphoribosyl transferase